MVEQLPASSLASSNSLPPKVLHLIVDHLYLCNVLQVESLEQHYCSLSDPCRIAFLAFSHFLSLRLVSSLWNEAVSKVRQESSFFRRVEDAYYPHLWHVNTKVRKFVVLRYYRTYHTISSEHGDRGVYHAYDFSSSAGCLAVKKVVLKTWVSASDNECLTESTAYDVFRSFSMAGIPVVLANSYDAGCDVHAIVLELLGPTLDDLCRLRPGGKLEDRMVLAVAIQMLDRYKDIHARGIIHNGIKPGNICLPPPDSNQDQSTLYAIDFGLSFTPDASSPYLLPSARRADTVGNRSFLSIYGHHGITHSQRDDLESLAYLLSFLRHGSLPWDDVQSLHLQSPSRSRSRSHSTSQDTNMRPQLWRIKMATPASILFLDMDSSYVEFWRDVRSLAFGEVPDYDMMKKRFVNCWVRERYGECPGEVNWWAVYEQSRKKKQDGENFVLSGSQASEIWFGFLLISVHVGVMRLVYRHVRSLMTCRLGLLDV